MTPVGVAIMIASWMLVFWLGFLTHALMQKRTYARIYESLSAQIADDERQTQEAPRVLDDGMATKPLAVVTHKPTTYIKARFVDVGRVSPRMPADSDEFYID
jgi:hypothetical protein